ncbi:hypothetical protein PG996_006741 [Apiospora saccharicola]|uniref:NACHT domain-containing protein n=1 Tax=Apiospora saccharicola TaxID=335842 RepID=A0ABR1V8V3_9PEZI
MDPISAFSLACNILQIVDTSAKVLVKAAECYNDGATAETSQLSGNLRLLESLGTELKHIEARAPSPLSTSELRLLEANERCLQVSDKLIHLLNGLRVNEKTVWQAISRSIKTVRHRETIAGLRESVSECRANLNLALLLVVHERSSGMQATTLKAHSDAEARILGTFDQQSTLLGMEIQRLSSKIEGISLDRSESTVKDFRSLHDTQLHQISQKVVEIIEQQQRSAIPPHGLDDSSSQAAVAAQQRVLESLHFPHMQERKGQISDVYEGTYRWMFREDVTMQYEKANFTTWLSKHNTQKNVYWVSGKPGELRPRSHFLSMLVPADDWRYVGSGKSALMRFVDQELEADNELLPWTDTTHVVKASHFLWKSGTTSQRSLEFLLRSLLYQLLDQAPDLIESSVSPKRWKSALSSDRRPAEWTLLELSQSLRSFIQEATCCVFILIDGLDELEDAGGRQAQLVDLIQSLGSFDTVKICVSSRPENTFRDNFGGCPQLRLQDLTSDDIHVFIRGQFTKQPRLRTLSQGDDRLVDTLVDKIAAASSGVFLWVCLVVAEVLEEARDGASAAELIEMVDKVPSDLDKYFSQIMGSIEPKHRAESSVMFQIALHKETTYVSLFFLRLLDLSFLEEGHSDFALRPEYNIAKYDTTKTGLTARLDSAFRRVNSRSRGLLEVHYVEGNSEDLFDLDGEFTTRPALGASQDTAPMAIAFNYHVSFLHRSFHDYLLEPENMEHLEQNSKGRYNSRLFLCNARLVQMLSLDYKRRPDHALLAFGLASALVSAISVDDLKFSKESVQIAAAMRPVVEFLAQSGVQNRTETPWYLATVLESYIEDHNSFLAVAIDFDLDAYLKVYLTREAIHTKTGRPILHNVLQRVIWIMEGHATNDSHVNLDILRLALDLGADPNELWHSVSVWGSFLLSLLDGSLDLDGLKPRQPCVEAIKVMLENSADPVLPAV